MKKNSILILVGSLFTLAACTYQKNNRIEQDDVDNNSTWVYGVSRDSAAAQLKQVYRPDPKNDAVVNNIHDILYGKTASVAADSTAK